MKVVYLWKNGQPVIVTLNDEGEYVYPDEKWTETKPDDGLYTPFYFDGQKWIGQTKEVFEQSLPSVEGDKKDEEIKRLNQKVAEQDERIEFIEKELATLKSNIEEPQA